LDEVSARIVIGYCGGHSRITDREGNNYRVAVGMADRFGKGKMKFRTRNDIGIIPKKSFGAWVVADGMLVLELDGTMNRYDYTKTKIFEDDIIENPKPFLPFKLKMDYFKN